jgi:hypothetical protein
MMRLSATSFYFYEMPFEDPYDKDYSKPRFYEDYLECRVAQATHPCLYIPYFQCKPGWLTKHVDNDC